METTSLTPLLVVYSCIFHQFNPKKRRHWFEKLSFKLTHILCLVYGTIQLGCDNIICPSPFTSMQSFNEIRCPPEGGVASDICRRN